MTTPGQFSAFYQVQGRVAQRYPAAAQSESKGPQRRGNIIRS